MFWCSQSIEMDLRNIIFVLNTTMPMKVTSLFHNFEIMSLAKIITIAKNFKQFNFKIFSEICY